MSGPPRITQYRDANNRWRWHIIGGNGEPIASSTQGYRTRRACDRSALLALQALEQVADD